MAFYFQYVEKVTRPVIDKSQNMKAKRLSLSDLKLSRFKKPGKQMFWAWIAYQCIKGTLTTSLIWIPLLYAWFH
jgi:hypothetical protein